MLLLSNSKILLSTKVLLAAEILNTIKQNNRDREERERDEHTGFILVPLTNREYSSPLALPRDLTIITKDYNPSAQAHKQESSNAQVTQDKRLLTNSQVINN